MPRLNGTVVIATGAHRRAGKGYRLCALPNLRSQPTRRLGASPNHSFDDYEGIQILSLFERLSSQVS